MAKEAVTWPRPSLRDERTAHDASSHGVEDGAAEMTERVMW
jgi:hypothetical protein